MKKEKAAPPSPEPPLRELVRHSLLYGATPFLRQLVSIGMHRLYTGWLQEPGLGVKETVDLWLIGLQQILGSNALSTMVRFYFDRHSERERAAIVTSCTLAVSTTAWIVCGTAYFFRRQLTPLLLGRGDALAGDELVAIVGLTLLLVPLQLSTLSGFYYLQILRRSGLFSLLQGLKLVFEVGLNFFLIGHLGLGVRGFLLSMLAGEALTSLLLCGWMLLSLGARIEWSALRPLISYALPLVPVGLCQLLVHQVDRRLLLALGTQSMAGIYGHGYKIGFVVTSLVLGPFLQIWRPWIFAVQESATRARLVARVTTYALLAIGAVSLLVIALGRQAVVLLAARPAFWEAFRIVPIVVVGYLFWALYYLSELPLLIAKRTLRLFWVNALAVLCNVGLNLWAIPRFGILGAAAATLVTFAFLALLGILAGRRGARVPLEVGRLAAILAGVTAAGGVALAIDERQVAGELGLGLAIALKLLVCGAVLALLVGKVLRPDERARFAAWLRARRAHSRAGSDTHPLPR
jgi:O-antigen/teichoic acid export membrane protein